MVDCRRILSAESSSSLLLSPLIFTWSIFEVVTLTFVSSNSICKRLYAECIEKGTKWTPLSHRSQNRELGTDMTINYYR